MSDPFGGFDPRMFEQVPLFRELAKVMRWSGGPVNWDLASQTALALAEAEGEAAPAAPAPVSAPTTEEPATVTETGETAAHDVPGATTEAAPPQSGPMAPEDVVDEVDSEAGTEAEPVEDVETKPEIGETDEPEEPAKAEADDDTEATAGPEADDTDATVGAEASDDEEDEEEGS
jgi:hypothetical protein